VSERWTVKIPPDIKAAIGNLAPEQKQRIRAVLKALETNVRLGKPLQRELAEFRSVTVRPFRVIDTVSGHDVHVRMVERRESVYELLAKTLPIAERRRRYGARPRNA